jgi:hypothetical protein
MGSRATSRFPLSAQDRRQLGVQNLDRDLAVVFFVVGEIDGGHSTRAQFALDGVGVKAR